MYSKARRVVLASLLPDAQNIHHIGRRTAVEENETVMLVLIFFVSLKSLRLIFLALNATKPRTNPRMTV